MKRRSVTCAPSFASSLARTLPILALAGCAPALPPAAPPPPVSAPPATPVAAPEPPAPLPFRLPCADDDATGCEAGCVDHVTEDCVTLATMLLKGASVTADPARGEALLHAACVEGSARGCIRLADRVQGETEKATLYRRACEAGANLGCVTAGKAYLDGRGVERDAAFAAGMFRRACERGNAAACFELGRLYEAGDGVGKDAARGFELFAKACKLGSDEGCLYAGRTEEVLPPRQ